MELMEIYHDRWPFLTQRRNFWLFLSKMSDLCYLIINTKIFEYCSLVVIVINTVFMIISDPTSDDNILNKSELAFFVIYTIELTLKMIGMGLFTKKIGFFRNAWNILDFIIVGGSSLNIVLKSLNLNLSALRSLRVLRPLKTISSVKSLKNIILTIFSSLPFLKDIYIILFFFYILFGITGLHLFHGILHSTCFDPSTNGYPINNFIALSGYCSADDVCPGISICIDSYSNPFYGQTNFDDLPGAMLMAFQASTTENWSTVMYFLSSSFTTVMEMIAIAYFVILLILINFIMNNLMLAVIVVKFNETHKMLEKSKAEVQHSEFCICNSGFNYAQMKTCGFFLCLSNLKVHSNLKTKAKRFDYTGIKQYLQPQRQLEVYSDYRFVIIETLNKINRSSDNPKNIAGPLLMQFKGERRDSAIREEKLRELIQKDSLKFKRKSLNDAETKRIISEKLKESKIMKHTQFKAFDTIEGKPLILDNDAENYEMIQEAKDLNFGPIREEPEKRVDSIPSSVSYSFEEKQYSKQKMEIIKKRQQSIVKKESISKNVPKGVSFDNTHDFQRDLQSSKDIMFDLDFKDKISESGKHHTIRDHSQPVFMGKHILSKRRYAKAHLDQHGNPESRRKSLRPILVDLDKAESEWEKLDLRKEQMKAEKEFNVFINSNMDLLKLDLNPCSLQDEFNYRDMKETILPSLVHLKTIEEQKKRKLELLKSKITMIYNTKYIRKGIEIDDDQTSETGAFYSSSQTKNNTITPIQSRGNSIREKTYSKTVSRSGTIPRGQTMKIRTTFHEDVGKFSKFYNYIIKCTDLVCENHDVQRKKENAAETEQEEIQAKKIKPAACKQKSKNFSTVTAFFQEEFNFGVTNNPMFPISVNQRLYQGLQNDSITKQKVIHTNWSGHDVECSPGLMDKTVHIFNKLNIEIHELWLPGMIGKFNMFRRNIRYFFNMNPVEVFFILLVLLNTIILSLNGLITDTAILDQINLYLTIIFTVEICLKFVGLGLADFSNEIFNIFDAIIVALSLAEIALGTNSQILSAIKVIRVLRTVRVLRISRILRNLKFMRTLIKIFQITLDQFVYITLLLVLFLTIFSLIGMQFYAGTWTFLGPGEVIAQNFESFFDAFLAMVDIMSIVNWNDTQVLLARTDVNYAISSIYLISWIFIGNYILLNLFIAVLLEGFSSAVLLNKIEDMNNEFEGIEKMVLEEIEEINKKKKTETEQKAEHLNYLSITSKTQADIENQREVLKNTIIYNYDNKIKHKDSQESDQDDKLFMQIKNQDLDNSFSSAEQDICKFIFKNPRDKKHENFMMDQIFCQESLFLFEKEGFIRRCFIKMVMDPLFESFILFIIFVSSMHLVISTYSDHTWDGSTIQLVLDIIDYVVNGIFILECMSKIIAFGFFWCEGSYLRDNWSVLDFFIVCSSILDMSLKSSNASFLGVLKIVRTLRPLRVLSHNPGLKIVIQCLFQSFTGIMNVAVVVFMVWLMFGILGMNLLSGKLGFCNFPDNRNYFYVNQTMCPDLGGVWQNRGCNFENIFSALSALFVFSNAENWNTYTYYWSYGDDSGIGPSNTASPYIVLFSIIIVFMSTFFLTKLFIGVIYSEFANEQEKVNRQNFRVVSDDQIKWIQMQKMIRAASPNYVEIIVPQNRFRLFLYNLVNSMYFEYFILTMICINMMTLGMIYDTMNPTYSKVIDFAGYIFTCVFILEAVFKIIAIGFSVYIENTYNKFDFFIVMISIVDVILTDFVNVQNISIYPLIGRIMRIMRVTRLFKIMKSKKLEGINKIIKTLFYSFPAIMNVSLVLFLVYFIYAVLGVFLFKEYDPAFSNFAQALLFLFKCSTGEAWPDYMYFDQTYNPIVASIFWHSYIFLTMFTLMNLFMSVIIDQFSNFYFNPGNPINSFEEIVDEFRICWLLFTSKERGDRIKSKDLINFFICLKSPLGFHIPLKKEKPSVYAEEFSINYFVSTLKFDINYVRRKISEMKLIEDRQGCVSFGQVLHAAMKNAFGKNCYTNSNNDTYKEIRKIELKTIAKIFNKKIENYDITYNKEQDTALIQAKTSNPFNNVLFSQMIFQIWYNHSKTELGNEDISSEDLEDLMNKNPDRQFEKQIMKNMKNLVTQKLSRIFSKKEKTD